VKILDSHLKGKKYIVGDKLTIADIIVASSLIKAF
jgi:glutathione S-transferase